MKRMPTWSRIFVAAVLVLVINVLWNYRVEQWTGGGMAAELLLNILPCAVIVGQLMLTPK